jgi:hypothetical protein
MELRVQRHTPTVDDASRKLDLRELVTNHIPLEAKP